MPVALLLCEGGPNSPDVRVLVKLLAGRCGQILPVGGKYGLGERVKARREALGATTVFGLLDRDFEEHWRAPVERPIAWPEGDEPLGWRWERKEIENYLVDPVVVGRALAPAAELASDYRRALELARDRIAVYEAARTALASSRRRFHDLPSAFGHPRGREKHTFPEAFDEDACWSAIVRQVGEHRETQLVDEKEVRKRWSALLPACRPEGERWRDFLYAFAGKDLLWAMHDDLGQRGFGGAAVFRERVLVALQQTSDDVGTWLPEWRALQELSNSV